MVIPKTNISRPHLAKKQCHEEWQNWPWVGLEDQVWVSRRVSFLDSVDSALRTAGFKLECSRHRSKWISEYENMDLYTTLYNIGCSIHRKWLPEYDNYEYQGHNIYSNMMYILCFQSWRSQLSRTNGHMTAHGDVLLPAKTINQSPLHQSHPANEMRAKIQKILVDVIWCDPRSYSTDVGMVNCEWVRTNACIWHTVCEFCDETWGFNQLPPIKILHIVAFLNGCWLFSSP